MTQAVHTDDDDEGAYWPAAHSAQAEAPGEYCPAMHPRQMMEPVDEEPLPAAQLEQLETPEAAEYLPAGQSVHAVDAAAPVLGWYFPAAQLVQS